MGAAKPALAQYYLKAECARGLYILIMSPIPTPGSFSSWVSLPFVGLHLYRQGACHTWSQDQVEIIALLLPCAKMWTVIPHVACETMSQKLSPGSGTTCPGQVSPVLRVLIPSHGHHRQAEGRDLVSFYLFTCQAFNEHLLCAWNCATGT